MMLWIICQTCGKTKHLDTNKPIGYEANGLTWRDFTPKELSWMNVPLIYYQDTRFWICHECLYPHIEDSTECGGVYYDWASIKDMFYNSLRPTVIDQTEEIDKFLEAGYIKEDEE